MLDAARLNYIAPMSCRPRYYADDASRDVLTLDPRPVAIEDARRRAHSLSIEGFELVSHKSAVENFQDPAEQPTGNGIERSSHNHYQHTR